LDLRDHLLQQPQEAERYIDRLREDGQFEQARLMERFLKGAYPGAPLDGDDDDALERKPGAKLSLFSVVLLAAASALLLAWLLAFDGLEKLRAFSSDSNY
jgi:hypothetical protein